MAQKGMHTWDLVVRYHRCPNCGYVIESRTDYEYRAGKYLKKLSCPRCQHNFTAQKAAQPSLGPFFGEPQPPEIEWGN